MKFSGFLPSPILLVLFALSTLRPAIAADQLLAQLYPPSQLTNGYRCPDLQFNNTDDSIITSDAIYIFARRETGAYYPFLLIGIINLKTAFKSNEYQIEWWTSGNLTGGIVFLSGDQSRLTFNTVQLGSNGSTVNNDGLFGFRPGSHKLEQVAWPTNSGGGGIPPIFGVGTNVAHTNMSYYIGRQGIGLRDGEYPLSLFAYNFVDGSVSRKTTPQKSWASVSYVPLGANGTLIMIGGMEAVGTKPLPIDQLYVYSIATDTWFIQPTTGTTPSMRAWTCAVVVSAGDNSSHQIHIYGGNRPEDAGAAPMPDNYYILSVPQFVWTRAPSVPHSYTQTRCVLLGPHRMLLTGGLRQTKSCEALVRILDLNTGNVTTSFADRDQYAVPGHVVAHIGGGPNGAASMTRPVAGFVDGLEAALATPLGTPLATPLAGPGGEGKDVVEPDRNHRRVPLAAIVGGTVGGVCFIALVVCGLLYWRRRTGTTPQPEEAVPQPEEAVPRPTVAEVDGQQRVEGAVSPVNGFPNTPRYEMASPAYEMSGKT